MLHKLTSRKFWMAVAGVCTGAALALGVDQEAIATVAGAVTTMASVVAYIAAEGRLDAMKC